mmetsp:Transcript_25770/g.41649  ORF Transcript_25770/g.41649 Transcript_25770/m.41649 type:complete len:400 (+) Transcript_25770:2076-3275(+)|eukprot:CAMPEP_0203765520 /NCGR_PEP_ID=MMETSP0098-20131031/18454_1 /ASSEMBLY_ACC=CAM_ASM_000208 /TAXON_ID=96639 /ORGANISM=" , Strain NY0313808BC1" /LENGTH=399 /DNA_ID=CAMNT_0050661779 /DNA_START=2027 /DNA_END=3226 /DNA_ORIENTATION=+
MILRWSLRSACANRMRFKPLVCAANVGCRGFCSRAPIWARDKILDTIPMVRSEQAALVESFENIKPGSKEFVQASRKMQKYDKVLEMVDRLDEARRNEKEWLEFVDDPEMAATAVEELDSLRENIDLLEDEIVEKMLPSGATDGNNVILEIRPGVGGDESSLFAYELLGMYEHLARLKGWKWDVLSLRGERRSVREGVVLISNLGGTDDSDVYGLLKFEGGVHRVQRVPLTESSGRVHTSTVSVMVLPEVCEEDIEINPGDLLFDTFRASGAGGQHVNTTESAVRVTHVPTNTVVAIQDERSQHHNRAKAMKILTARVYEKYELQRREEENKLRSTVASSGERSDKIRTYNYSRDQITDHRLGESIFGIDGILTGGSVVELVQKILVPLYMNEKLEGLK